MIHPELSTLPVEHLPIEGFDRSKSIGGTDISIICGVNKWENVQDLYKSKRGLLPPKEVNSPMEWGLRHEPAIRKKVADTYPDLTVLEPDVHYPGVMRSREFPWAHCSPDSFTIDGAGTLKLVEIKSASTWSKKDWGTSWSHKFPMYYRYQIQWYLFITGLQEAYLPALIGGSDFREYKVIRNEGKIADMISHAKCFLDNLKHDIVPSSGVAENIKKSMLEKYPAVKEPNSYVKAEPKHNKIADRLMWVKGQQKDLKAEASKLQKVLEGKIGDNEGIEGPDWIAKWSRWEKPKTDWDMVIKDGEVDESIVDKHTTMSPQGRLNIKKTT